MFREIQDDAIFRQFWHDEKTNTPRFFQDSTNAWHCSEADFLEFCRGATVYLINNNILVYAEPTGEVHLSVLRGTDTSNLVSDLMEVRNELFKRFDILFAWVGTRGLRKIMTALGFSFRGYTMVKGRSRGKVLTWECFILAKKELLCRNRGNLINF